MFIPLCVSLDGPSLVTWGMLLQLNNSNKNQGWVHPLCLQGGSRPSLSFTHFISLNPMRVLKGQIYFLISAMRKERLYTIIKVTLIKWQSWVWIQTFSLQSQTYMNNLHFPSYVSTPKIFPNVQKFALSLRRKQSCSLFFLYFKRGEFN